MTRQPNTSRWTLRKYLDEIYIPTKRRSIGLTIDTADWYRQVATTLRVWRGHDPKLRELTDCVLDDFRAWSIARGCKERTARYRVDVVRYVLRHWRPEEHPKRTPGAPAMNFMEADVTGTLEQICRDHYFPENTKVSSPLTIRQYGRCLRRFSEFLGHAATPADLSDLIVGRYLRQRVEDGLKARSANGEVKQLKALWNWLAKKRVVDRFPTIGKLPEPELIPKAWTRDELHELIAACAAQTGKIARIDAAAYWLAFHLVLWDTGERTGAMLALMWPMVDLKTGHLSVPAEVRKGRRKAMVYRLKPATLEVLKRIRSPERELIFPVDSRNVNDSFSRCYRRLVMSAGLPWVPHKSGPQKMRRTFASFITAAGGDATKALRHSTTRVTEESYNDPTIANPTPPNAVLFDLIDSGKGGAT